MPRALATSIFLVLFGISVSFSMDTTEIEPTSTLKLTESATIIPSGINYVSRQIAIVHSEINKIEEKASLSQGEISVFLDYEIKEIIPIYKRKFEKLFQISQGPQKLLDSVVSSLYTLLYEWKKEGKDHSGELDLFLNLYDLGEDHPKALWYAGRFIPSEKGIKTYMKVVFDSLPYHDSDYEKMRIMYKGEFIKFFADN